MDQTWDLEISRRMQDGVAVVAVRGRLGTDASGRMIESLLEVLAEGHRRILVDLERVDYVSSAGLLALDAAAGRVHQAGGTLVLCSLCEPVRLVFELAGLLSEFTVESSCAAGLERARAGT